MSTEFVDPRSDPRPPSPLTRLPARHGEELRDLVQLCTAGRIYDVERWIRDGRSIQAETYKRPRKSPVLSPLRPAIRRRRRDLVRTFGYALKRRPQSSRRSAPSTLNGGSSWSTTSPTALTLRT